MSHHDNGGDSFYIIGTLVVVIGLTVAAVKWRSGADATEWRALMTGTSAPAPRPPAMPTVVH